MKYFYCFLLVSFMGLEIVMAQNSYSDLIERVSFYTEDSYTSAIEDLQKSILKSIGLEQNGEMLFPNWNNTVKSMLKDLGKKILKLKRKW